MKFTTLLVGAFAAIAMAAPAPNPDHDELLDFEQQEESDQLEKRTAINAGQLNNFNFRQNDIRYLQGVNRLDLALFQQLGRNNNFNVGQFQNLFNVQAFDINSILQLQQLHTLLVIANTGVFNTFDLSNLALGNLNLALIQPVGGVDLTRFIDVKIVPQVQTIANGVPPTIIVG